MSRTRYSVCDKKVLVTPRAKPRMNFIAFKSLSDIYIDRIVLLLVEDILSKRLWLLKVSLPFNFECMVMVFGLAVNPLTTSLKVRLSSATFISKSNATSSGDDTSSITLIAGIPFISVPITSFPTKS